ncbi:MAG: universal stress protein [Paramuribaculum sp.]|nr:universal stress protein [Paramuribaculum sp.]
MTDDRLITVAIHTYDRARALKSLLEQEGVEVTLQNVNLSSPVSSAGVRVRIHESALPLALRIIENQELFTVARTRGKGEEPIILVPVDFSDTALQASKTAFRLANTHSAQICLLHASPNPAYSNRIQLAAILNYDSQSEDEDSRKAIADEANRQMDLFTSKLLASIKAGEIPAARFSTKIAEGLPEEVISQFVRQENPMLLVMGTRGTDAKERDLLGSVTAEVLDTCRTPVFTVPAIIDKSTPTSPLNILFLSNFDQEDILALDMLFKLAPGGRHNITLLKVPGKKSSDIDTGSLKALRDYCTKHYPDNSFLVESLNLMKADEQFNELTRSRAISIIAVPNKKKNIFVRLFNPGIAHRLLFSLDIPMIVLPV